MLKNLNKRYMVAIGMVLSGLLYGCGGGGTIITEEGGGALAGSWFGDVSGQFTVTSNRVPEVSMDFEQHMDITFDNDGAPVGLPLLALGSFGAGSAGEVSEIEIGASSEVVSEMELPGLGTIVTTSTMEVMDAEINPDRFYIVYWQTARQESDAFDQYMEGTVTYDAVVEGDSLMWSQELDFEYEQSAGGGLQQVGTQTGTLEGQLLRQ